MRHFKLWQTTVVTLLCSLTASAHDFEMGGIYYNIISDTEVEVTLKGDSYNSYKNEYSGSVTIPSTVTYNGTKYSVTSIGDEAFRYCYNLTAITIPESVTSIGKFAFQSCRLTSISIPKDVTSIGDFAFLGSGLTFITIPKGVTSIGDETFRDCSSLTAIIVEEGNMVYDSRNNCNAIIETSSNTLIQGCSTTIIPENVTGIGKFAFFGHSSLTAITIPKSVTSIGIYAFGDCSRLTSIVVDKDNAVYDSRNNCNAIIETSSNTMIQGCSTTMIPEGVTSIGFAAFLGCIYLTAITIPEGVTSIGSYAFSDCRNLISITLPEGMTSIGYNAFDYCLSLTSITLPESVTNIEDVAFWYCTSLTCITCKAATPPAVGSDAFYPVDKSIPVYVPASALESYKATAPWNEFSNIESIQASVSTITLNQSSAILLEGESITLTATITPKYATDCSVTWSSSNEDVAMVSSKGKVITLAPGTAIITATANDGSGVSASCEIRVVLGKCEAPTINYVDGKVLLTCDTEGAEIVTTIEKGDDETHKGFEFDYIPTQTFTAYATKEDFADSDSVTLILCWVPCTEEHESEDTGILTIPSKPVLIQCTDDVIILTGLAECTEVVVYDLAGHEVGNATAENGTATIPTDLTAGSTAIVKIGEHSVKVLVK